MENLKEVNHSHNSKNPDIAVETEVTSDEFRNLEVSLFLCLPRNFSFRNFTRRVHLKKVNKKL